MRAANHPWAMTVRVDDVPETGRRFVLAADEATRTAVAGQAGVVGIVRLEAALDLARAGRDGVRVTGEVSATVRQTCVVTLEPIDNEIKEAVDVAFTLGPPDAGTRGAEPADIVVGAPEPPERLLGGTIDLAAIATEFLILGIDPYPRKSDAVFEAPPAADTGTGPFAILADLKKPDGERGV
jgi:uncharacterized metal-binding protein YceD (DUF177 family)